MRYGKDGRLAYLGHLEVMNTIIRCVRRSGLAFEVGNGFARRMRIQFSQALPVGASSEGEYYDLKLPERPDPDEALRLLAAATPRALAPNAAVVLPRKLASLEAWANMSLWDVVIRNPSIDAARFMDAIEELRLAGSIDFMRGDKPRHLELGTTLVSCEATDAGDDVRVVLTTRSSERGALRPSVLVDAAVGCMPLRVRRRALWHEGPDGERVDPMCQEA